MKAAAPVAHVGYHKTATTWLQENLFPLAVSHAMIPRPIIKQVLEPPGLTFDVELARERLLAEAGGLPPLISEKTFPEACTRAGLTAWSAPKSPGGCTPFFRTRRS